MGGASLRGNEVGAEIIGGQKDYEMREVQESEGVDWRKGR